MLLLVLSTLHAFSGRDVQICEATLIFIVFVKSVILCYVIQYTAVGVEKELFLV